MLQLATTARILKIVADIQSEFDVCCLAPLSGARLTKDIALSLPASDDLLEG